MFRRLMVVVAAIAITATAIPPAATAQRPVPTLSEIRVAHHRGFDRVVFEFRGGLPAERSFEYVDKLIADGSGKTLPIAGNAILQVRFGGAQAHTASGRPTTRARSGYATPNVMQIVRSGDFEAVVNHGIGLARRQHVHMFVLRRPARVVLDIDTHFRTTPVSVYYVDLPRFVAGKEPYVRAVRRPVIPPAVARGALQRLFARPTATERADGLRLVRSKAKGFTNLRIAHKIARVQLTGGCDSAGSTLTIANEIFPTLKQFPSVRWVKIYDPSGHTETPAGRSDSIPTCLEP
jgi:hypothetical protein